MWSARLKIPADFILARGALTWRDVAFGLDEELLAPAAAIELAVAEVRLGASPSPALLELAALEASDFIRDHVERLAGPVDDAGSRERWLPLVLGWLYECRASLSDPLTVLEYVHADFGYPPAMAPMIRYLPATEPLLGSRDANEARMLDRWRQYVEGSPLPKATAHPKPPR